MLLDETPFGAGEFAALALRGGVFSIVEELEAFGYRTGAFVLALERVYKANLMRG